MSAQNLKIREEGAAIVIVLAFVVLLTSLVFAFFSRAVDQRQISNSSAGQMRADILAKGALETLVGDLHQEIAAGSIVTTPGNLGVRAYEPKNKAIVPAKVGAAPDMPNLIKRSVAGEPFFDGVDYDTANYPASDRSSSVLTTEPSLNGRYISPERWNNALLLPPSPVNSTPPESWVPQWIVVSRDGSNPTAWSKDLSDAQGARYVTGRYAYAIYNIGGLLDANVAGYPGSVAIGDAAKKGSLALADLTAVPGITQAMVDTLAGWRNYATLQASGTFPMFATLDSARFLEFVRDPDQAFVKVNNQVHNSRTDQLFLSRQELIGFARSIGIPDDALQNFTTFSREWNAPSWKPARNAVELDNELASLETIERPSPDPGAAFAYKDNRDSLTAVNRNIANLRAAATRVITSYRADGTSYTYIIQAGAPWFQRRFPLGRLAWVGRDGPANGGNDTNIQACFGLKWNNAAKRWNYVGHTGTSLQSSIASLETVLGQTREANFFELLQAGILQGSLGLRSSANSMIVLEANQFGAIANQAAAAQYQIVQIAANLLDQYDGDSFPSRICFRAGSVDQEFYGSESLPLINKYIMTGYRGPSKPRMLRTWMEFEMWNPYNSDAAANGAEPAQFKIGLVGSAGANFRAQVDINKAYTPTPTLDMDERRGFTIPAAVVGNALTVTRAGAAGLGEAARDPLLVDALRRNGSVSVTGCSAACIFTEGSASYTGLYLGEYDLANGISEPPDPSGLYLRMNGQPDQPFMIRPMLSGSPSIELSYDYGGGNFLPVQRIRLPNDGTANTFIPQESGPRSTSTALPQNFTTPNMRAGSLASALDPRTHRFGLSGISRRGTVVNTPETVASPNLTPFWNKAMAGYSEPGSNPAGPADGKAQYSHGTFPRGAFFAPNLDALSGTALTEQRLATFRYADNRGTGTQSVRIPSEGVTIHTDPYYMDRDGTRRYADGTWNTSTPAAASFVLGPVNPPYSNSSGGSYLNSRPVILNRPFLSVGEMSYAYRDLPFKSLDFSTANSADAALLDLFCIHEGDSSRGLLAGRVDLNGTNSTVLKAILTGTTRTTLDPANNLLTVLEADAIANALIATSSGPNGPLQNVADLATRLGPDPAWTDVIKARKEAAIGALADVGQTRTWNLMIDVIAQSGRYPSHGNVNGLEDFVVEGERRYWLQVAIDRFTGQVVDQKLEAVTN